MKQGMSTALFLAILLVFGNGWSQDIIQISNIEQLQQIGREAQYPMNGHYVLAGDIDASATSSWDGGKGFIPLGGLQAPNTFTGTFDGADYTISGLVINRGDDDVVGLFRIVDTVGIIKNVNFSGIQVTGNQQVAGSVASNKGSIENIQFDNTCRIYGERYVGSVVGYNDGGDITDCDTYAKVEGISISTGDGYVGGIAGYSGTGGCISNCYARNKVIGISVYTGYTGGIVGQNTGHITHCRMSGELDGKQYTGGIVGDNDSGGVIDNCSNQEKVTGTSHVGGIAGKNVGDIYNSYTNDNVIVVATDTYGPVGGFVGYNTGTIRLCFSSSAVSGGSINVSSGGVGGFVGRMMLGEIRQSFASGNVSGTGNCIGGFAGYISSGEIIQCFSLGDVSGLNDVGGLAGEKRSAAKITECYAVGKVTGTSRIGGLLAWGENNITRCYWDIETSGTAISAGGTGLYTWQMQQEEYYVDWDFASVWGIAENEGYPFLLSINLDCMPDITPPVITLSGNSEVVVDCGTFYTDEGATAWDACDGDLTGSVLIGGDLVDTATPGTYIITYDVNDNMGNGHHVIRTVTVLDNCPGEGEGEEEGEIPTEGEGENPIEGEGELIEGEIIIEGEGEVQYEGEGEGESVVEGEGEVFTEGEGEMPSEGEGETSIEGEGETETILLLPGTVPLEMVWIPGGMFQMGRYPGETDSDSNEDPQHSVTVPGFWMGKYEVTQQQWLAVMGSWPGTPPSITYGLGDNYPAYYISWDDAKDFITALNTHIVNTGQEPLMMRLPSEAEWEYACRADTTTRFYWGDDLSYTEIENFAWIQANSDGKTNPVGMKTANAFGLFDISGNVIECCEDDLHANYVGAPIDGSAWVDSPRYSMRVVRGGSWANYTWRCRSANRGQVAPGNSVNYVGFRVAADEINIEGEVSIEGEGEPTEGEPVEGECEGEQSVPNPADMNQDFRMVLSEAIAYLTGWQQGSNPIAYAIRAAYLWQNGEQYIYDAEQAPPLCWVLAP